MAEVWDGPNGWRLTDPGTIPAVGRPHPAGAAGPTPDPAPPQAVGPPPLYPGDPESHYYRADTGLLTGPRVYPKPWLHMRTGPRSGHRPLNGRFVVMNPQMTFGPAQGWCRVGIGLCGRGLRLSASAWAVKGVARQGPGARAGRPAPTVDRAPARARAPHPSPDRPGRHARQAPPGRRVPKECVAGDCVCGGWAGTPAHG